MSDADVGFFFYKLSNLFSVWLTIPTILFSTIVCMKWYPEAIIACRTPANSRTSAQWFILGVAIGFAGSIINNFFLCIVWSSVFLENAATDYLFYNRVYSNIFCQITGIFAAYCHIRAALQYSSNRESTVLKKTFLLSIAGATTFSLTLIYIAIADLWSDVFSLK